MEGAGNEERKKVSEKYLKNQLLKEKKSSGWNIHQRTLKREANKHSQMQTK